MRLNEKKVTGFQNCGLTGDGRVLPLNPFLETSSIRMCNVADSADF